MIDERADLSRAGCGPNRRRHRRRPHIPTPLPQLPRPRRVHPPRRIERLLAPVGDPLAQRPGVVVVPPPEGFHHRLRRALEVPPETVLRDWHAARAAGDEAPATLELARPECGYRATFVAESRSALDAAH